jgi:hypothetical protein
MKVAITLLLSVFLLLPAIAQQPASFTANYQTGAPAIHGASVQVTLSVRLYNNTSGNVSGATLNLLNPASNGAPYATFDGVAIPAGGSAVFTQAVTVPQAEYQRWQKGGKALLALTYPGNDGNVTFARVFATQLAPGPTL